MQRMLNACLAPAGLFISLAFASGAQAQDSDYTAPADEMAEAMVIMDAMFPADSREETMLDTVRTMGDQVAQAMMTGPIFEEPGIRAIMDEFLQDLPETMRPLIVKHLPSMIKATAIAYTREFTLEELQDISAFAGTPSGKRYFSSVQRTLSDPVIAASNQAFFGEVAAVQQEQVQLVQGRVAEYLRDNPEVLQRLQEAGVGQ